MSDDTAPIVWGALFTVAVMFGFPLLLIAFGA